MTHQSALLQVHRHFLIQRQDPVVWYGEYRYRTPNDHCCTVGCLVPRALYQEDWEDKPITQVLKQDHGLASWFTGIDPLFLFDLQIAHDAAVRNSWEGDYIDAEQFHQKRHEELVEVARIWDLELPSH